MHERVLTVPEEAERKNLAGFIGHALRLDESAVIRMRRRGDAHLSVWASTGFDALATRTVAGTINLTTPRCRRSVALGGGAGDK